MAMANPAKDGDFPWHLGVFDAHCHPTDTVSSLHSIPSMRAKILMVMATRAQDQELVGDLADKYGLFESEIGDADLEWIQDHKIIPAFGWHPWFSYQMFHESDYDGARTLSVEQKIAHYQSVLIPKPQDHDLFEALPEPRSCDQFILQTRSYLKKHPLALVGEVGLDRGFRIQDPTRSVEKPRRLTPYRVTMEHQKKVLLAQLALAGEMQRAVSCHGVQAHGAVYETLAQTWNGHERRLLSNREKKKMKAEARNKAVSRDPADKQDGDQQSIPNHYPPRICLHSYSGPAETIKQYIAPSVPCKIYFSFSTAINNWSEDGNGKVEAAVKAVPDDRLLIESDLDTAGPTMDEYLEKGVRQLCKVKGWGLEDGVRRLGNNWMGFAFGIERKHKSS